MDYKLAEDGPAFIKRLDECMAEFKSAYAFYSATGLSKGTVAGYLKGSDPSRKKIVQVASALKISPAWLAFGMGEKRPRPLSNTDWVPIPEVALSKDAQSGAVSIQKADPVFMVRSSVVAATFLGSDPGNLAAFRMPDSLLSQTIFMGEWTILNLADRDAGAGGTFCVSINGTVTVRHVGLAGVDRIRISTDDPGTHPPVEILRSDSAVLIVGRAIIAAAWVR